MQDFYLVSTELREPYEPRACNIIKRLYSELRDDLALVEVSPPLPLYIYDSAEDLNRLIIAARHEGTSIFPVSEWPLGVYICCLKEQGDLDQDVIRSEDLTILDWGEIRRNS